MSYQRERSEFTARAAAEGLSFLTINKLLRYASTLQRLAVAQCNGDYPYNGDRDRPYPSAIARNNHSPAELADLAKQRARWDARYTVCPKCETSGVAKSAMRWKTVVTRDENGKVKYRERVPQCPDCRTQELVLEALRECGHRIDDTGLIDNPYRAHFGGDPRGAVFVLATPNFPYDESGRNGARGLYVPARER